MLKLTKCFLYFFILFLIVSGYAFAGEGASNNFGSSNEGQTKEASHASDQKMMCASGEGDATFCSKKYIEELKKVQDKQQNIEKEEEILQEKQMLLAVADQKIADQEKKMEEISNKIKNEVGDKLNHSKNSSSNNVSSLDKSSSDN